MKKLLILFMCIIFANCVVLADESTFTTHFNAAEEFYRTANYTKAIAEYQKALRINHLDNSTIIGIANSHLARGNYFATIIKDLDRAANDYRSALFYLEIYPDNKNLQATAETIQGATDILEEYFQATNYDKSPYSRYKTADKIRNLNEYAAAVYEYSKAAVNGDNNIGKNANRNIADIIKSRIGNYQKAGEYYKEALKYAPNDSGLHNSYAQMLMKTGKDDLAITEFNKALETAQNPTYILFNLEKLYSKKLQAKPNDLMTLVNFASILERQGKENAIDYYKKAEQINPRHEYTLLKLANYYTNIGDFTNAKKYYNTCLEINPNNIEVLYSLGDYNLKQNKKPEAAEYFKKVINIKPDYAHAQEDLIICLDGTMTPSEILKYISPNGTISEGAVNVMYNYAKILHKDKKAKQALMYYNEVLKNKQNVEIYTNIALANLQEKDELKAAQVLTEGLQKYPSNAQMKEMLEDVYKSINSDKYENASKLFQNNEYQKALETYLAIQPETQESTMAIAACYKSLNDLDNALKYYKKALTFNAKNDNITYYIGVLYTEMENWTSAKIYLQETLRINPNNEKATELLTSVIEQNNILLINKVIENYNKNDYETALKIISQILTEDSNNTYAHYYRGLIYDAQKKYPQAIDEFKKAYEHNSSLIVTNYLIALAYDAQAQYKNALIYYKKFVNLNQENDEYKAYAKSRINDLKGYEK